MKNTTDLGIFYKRSGDANLTAYTDTDYAENLDNRKSTSGYVFSLSGGAVSRASKKQLWCPCQPSKRNI